MSKLTNYYYKFKKTEFSKQRFEYHVWVHTRMFILIFKMNKGCLKNEVNRKKELLKEKLSCFKVLH